MQPTDPTKFTDKAWEAVVKSQDVARRFQNQNLEVEHLITALLEQNGLATNLMSRAGVDTDILANSWKPSPNVNPELDALNIYIWDKALISY